MAANRDLKIYFKDKLYNSRISLNLSQEKMAERLDISPREYIELEHGNKFCSAESLINFVNNCNVDKDNLFDGFAGATKKSEE